MLLNSRLNSYKTFVIYVLFSQYQGNKYIKIKIETLSVIMLALLSFFLDITIEIETFGEVTFDSASRKKCYI